MNNNPLVSVIIIFLNAEKYIEEAIESVLAQTYSHWELLLVDDGSTDGSTAIARRYAAQYPERVHYLEHPGHQNRGKDRSRNLGGHHAKGKYIAFLDADDVLLPAKLTEQVAIMNNNPAVAMLYGDTLYWYSWTGRPEDKQQDFVPGLGVQPGVSMPPPLVLSLYLRGTAAVPCVCSILVRRSAFETVKGFEESFQGLYEDQAFYAKVCLKFPVMAMNTCWDRYRQHPESSVAVSGKLTEQTTARQFFLKWLAAYLVEQKITDAAVWQALQKELWLSRQPAWTKNSAARYRLVRWLKKWLLRLEEHLLPAPLQRRLWSPKNPAWPG